MFQLNVWKQRGFSQPFFGLSNIYTVKVIVMEIVTWIWTSHTPIWNFMPKRATTKISTEAGYPCTEQYLQRFYFNLLSFVVVFIVCVSSIGTKFSWIQSTPEALALSASIFTIPKHSYFIELFKNDPFSYKNGLFLNLNRNDAQRCTLPSLEKVRFNSVFFFFFFLFCLFVCLFVCLFKHGYQVELQALTSIPPGHPRYPSCPALQRLRSTIH